MLKMFEDFRSKKILPSSIFLFGEVFLSRSQLSIVCLLTFWYAFLNGT